MERIEAEKLDIELNEFLKDFHEKNPHKKYCQMADNAQELTYEKVEDTQSTKTEKKTEEKDDAIQVFFFYLVVTMLVFGLCAAVFKLLPMWKPNFSLLLKDLTGMRWTCTFFNWMCANWLEIPKKAVMWIGILAFIFSILDKKGFRIREMLRNFSAIFFVVIDLPLLLIIALPLILAIGFLYIVIIMIGFGICDSVGFGFAPAGWLGLKLGLFDSNIKNISELTCKK